jgi:hypothetical protein
MEKSADRIFIVSNQAQLKKINVHQAVILINGERPA